MTLKFDKVQPQVARMGRALAARSVDMSARADDAWDLLRRLDDLYVIRDQVWIARDRDAGFRGAASGFDHDTGDLILHEPFNQIYPLLPPPARATIMAADGSQVYPNPHAAALYYLLNVGVFAYHHGTDFLPEEIFEPRLHYADSDIYDKAGQLVTNDMVNKRRSVMELQILLREARRYHDSDYLLVAMVDGPLLFWVKKDMPDGEQLERDYLGYLLGMYDLDATMPGAASLVGYVDRPSSAFIVSLLHLMTLDESEVTRANLSSNGAFEGLEDRQLLWRLLHRDPGARTALMVQQSPRNKDYRLKNTNLEIAFFYINVGTPENYQLARVEMPMWVAQKPDTVNHIQALLYDQCQMMWRYPYALTRADELAVIRAHERDHLANLIEIELMNNEQAVDHTQKERSKAVRHGRTRYAPTPRG